MVCSRAQVHAHKTTGQQWQLALIPQFSGGFEYMKHLHSHHASSSEKINENNY